MALKPVFPELNEDQLARLIMVLETVSKNRERRIIDKATRAVLESLAPAQKMTPADLGLSDGP